MKKPIAPSSRRKAPYLSQVQVGPLGITDVSWTSGTVVVLTFNKAFRWNGPAQVYAADGTPLSGSTFTQPTPNTLQITLLVSVGTGSSINLAPFDPALVGSFGELFTGLLADIDPALVPIDRPAP